MIFKLRYSGCSFYKIELEKYFSWWLKSQWGGSHLRKRPPEASKLPNFSSGYSAQLMSHLSSAIRQKGSKKAGLGKFGNAQTLHFDDSCRLVPLLKQREQSDWDHGWLEAVEDRSKVMSARFLVRIGFAWKSWRVAMHPYAAMSPSLHLSRHPMAKAYQVLYVSGKPGTGKTASVLQVVSAMQKTKGLRCWAENTCRSIFVYLPDMLFRGMLKLCKIISSM